MSNIIGWNVCVLPIALVKRHDLEPSDKLIWAAIARRVLLNGPCAYSIRTLANDTGLSVSTILLGKNRLKAKGLLSEDNSGGNRKYIFRIDPTVLKFDTVDGNNGVLKFSTECTDNPSATVLNFGAPAVVIQTPPHKSNSQTISFNPEQGDFAGITPEGLNLWRDAYPGVVIEMEIKQAAQWLFANPKRRKKNYQRFLVNWFKRAQDRVSQKAGTNGATHKAVHAEESLFDFNPDRERQLEETFDKEKHFGKYAQESA